MTRHDLPAPAVVSLRGKLSAAPALQAAAPPHPAQPECWLRGAVSTAASLRGLSRGGRGARNKVAPFPLGFCSERVHVRRTTNPACHRDAPQTRGAACLVSCVRTDFWVAAEGEAANPVRDARHHGRAAGRGPRLKDG